MLKEKKVIAAEASESGINNAEDLEWRKISDSGLLETMLSQVDSLHTSNSNSSGKYLKNSLLFEKNYPIVRYFTWYTLKLLLYSSSNSICQLPSN